MANANAAAPSTTVPISHRAGPGDGMISRDLSCAPARTRSGGRNSKTMNRMMIGIDERNPLSEMGVDSSCPNTECSGTSSVR